VHRAWRKLYAESHPPVDAAGRIAIIVDDGIEVTDDMVVAALSGRTLAQRARKSRVLALLRRRDARARDVAVTLDAAGDQSVICSDGGALIALPDGGTQLCECTLERDGLVVVLGQMHHVPSGLVRQRLECTRVSIQRGPVARDDSCKNLL
jgi:hypothetical protein